MARRVEREDILKDARRLEHIRDYYQDKRDEAYKSLLSASAELQKRIEQTKYHKR